MATPLTLVAYQLLVKGIDYKEVSRLMGVNENTILKVKSRYLPFNSDLDTDYQKMIAWVKIANSTHNTQKPEGEEVE